ncbi:MAG: hypothetical protein ACOH5I_02785 [Oligoflexus sp.]
MAYASFRCQVVASEQELWSTLVGIGQDRDSLSRVGLSLSDLVAQYKEDGFLANLQEKLSIDHEAQMITFSLTTSCAIQGERQIRLKVDPSGQSLQLECALDWRQKTNSEKALVLSDELLEALVKVPVLRLKSLVEKRRAC